MLREFLEKSVAPAAIVTAALAAPAASAATQSVQYEPLEENFQSAPRLVAETPRWQSESYTPSGGTSVSMRSDNGVPSCQIARQATNVTFYTTADIIGMTPEQIMEAHQNGELIAVEGLKSNVQFAVVNLDKDGSVNHAFVQHGYRNDGLVHFIGNENGFADTYIPTAEQGGSSYLISGLISDDLQSGNELLSVTTSDHGHVGILEFRATANVRKAVENCMADINDPEKVAEAAAKESKIIDYKAEVVTVSEDYKMQLISQTRGDVHEELKKIDPADVDVVRYMGGQGSILATVDGVRFKLPNGDTLETFGCYLRKRTDQFGNVVSWEASMTTYDLKNESCLPPAISKVSSSPDLAAAAPLVLDGIVGGLNPAAGSGFGHGLPVGGGYFFSGFGGGGGDNPASAFNGASMTPVIPGAPGGGIPGVTPEPNDGNIIPTPQVPLPATGLLLAAAVGALGFARRWLAPS